MYAQSITKVSRILPRSLKFLQSITPDNGLCLARIMETIMVKDIPASAGMIMKIMPKMVEKNLGSNDMTQSNDAQLMVAQ